VQIRSTKIDVYFLRKLTAEDLRKLTAQPLTAVYL